MENKTLIRNKNFLLLFQGTLTSNIAASLYTFAMGFYLLEITNNNSMIQGTYLAVCGIVFVVFSLVGGILSDRWNKVKIIYFSDFIKGALITGSAFAFYFLIKNNNNSFQVVIIFILGIINNIIASIFSPTSQSMLPLIVEEDRLLQANSLFSLLNSFVSILGIVIAGVLYTTISITLLFLIVGICYILSGVSELFIKIVYEKNYSKITLKLLFDDFKDGFNCLKPHKAIISIIICFLFINFFFSPIFSNALPLIIKVDIANSDYMFKDYFKPEMWSTIFSILFSIGSIVMSVVISKKEIKCSKGRWLQLIVLEVAFLILLITLNYLFVMPININIFIIAFSIILVLLGIAIVSINVPIMTLLQTTIDKTKLAKVMSLINIGSTGLIPFASFIAGVIIMYGSIGWFFIYTTIGFMFTTFLMLFNKKIKSL